MSKIHCTCGEVILDSTDFLSNKAYYVADQDWFEMLSEVETTQNSQLSSRALSSYTQKIFECIACGSLVVIKSGKKFVYTPQNNAYNQVLISKQGKAWKGFLKGKFTRQHKGELFWSSNITSGFEFDLELEELRRRYDNKLEFMKSRDVLRFAQLKIEGEEVDRFGEEM